MSKCVLCGKVLVGGQTKFCSSYCRTKHWVTNHRDRDRAFKKKHRLKQAVFCRACGVALEPDRRGPGVVHCSAECSRRTRNSLSRAARRAIHKAFGEYKKSIGCLICGYKRCGACLDFHHRKPEDKSFRITATRWRAGSAKVKQEIAKCDLLCKCCHYEQHHQEL
jgi:hypothetical protein